MSQIGSSSSNYSPQKSSSGQYIYSKSKKVNQVLNSVGLSDSRVASNLG
jgi:phage repressor protein C with HTH and peptisase S24 domain